MSRMTTISFAKSSCAAVFALAATAAWAGPANVQWQAYEGSYDGVFTNPNHWSLGHVPAGADEGAYVFPGYGVTGTVSCAHAVVTNASAFLKLSVCANGTASDGVTTFDCTGGRFLMPDLVADATVYNNEPFGFRRQDAHFFNLQTYSAAAASGTQTKGLHAIAEMTNAVIRMTDYKGSRWHTRVDFLQGYLNLFDPCGSAWATKPYIIFPGANVSYESTFEVEFHPGSETRLPTLYCQGNARTNVLAFAGGRHEVLSTTYVPHSSQAFHYNNNAKDSHTFFVVSNTADVAFNGFAVGCDESSLYHSPSNMYAHVDVAQDGRLAFGGVCYFGSYADLDLRVHDGGTLAFDGTAAATFGNAGHARVRLDVADATLALEHGAKAAFGVGNANYQAADCPAVCTLTNAWVANGGTLSLYSGTMDVLGGTWSNATFAVGNNSCGYPAAATFRDVTVDSYGPLQIEAGGTLTVDGGTHRWYGSVYPGCTAVPVEGGYGRLVITNDASILVQTRSGGTVSFTQVGSGVGSSGVVEQYDGLLDVQPVDGVVIGQSGVGRYEMRGGTLRTTQIRLGYVSNCAKDGKEDVLRQTGGLIDVTSTDSYRGVNVPDGNGNTARLILDGGTLRCHAVRGWTGAHAKGGTGWGYLEANGGTIELPQGNVTENTAIENFDAALLGPKGLTFSSAYEVKFAQDFADRADAVGTGLLRLTGSGVKYVMSTNSAPSRFQVEEGLAVFTPRNGRPAKMASAVTVTNEGGLSLMGEQTSIAFKSLTMANRARLQLDAGDVFRVEGAVELGTLRVKISDDVLPIGVYTGLVAQSAVSDAAKNAWTCAMLVSPLDEGNVVSFTTVEEGGETFFLTTIREGTPLAGDTALRGTTWDDAASWGTGKPDGTLRAVIDGESPAAATVATIVDVGALRFNRAGGAALSGAGTLHVADSGYAAVESLLGFNAVDLAMGWSGALTFSVASGSSLTLGGRVFGNQLVKTLGGALYLTGSENCFDGGFSANGGKLSFAGTAATGIAASDAEGVVTAGTLEFTAPTTLEAPVRVATPEANGVATFKTDADVVLRNPVFEQGALVKRGSSSLTLDFTRGASLATGDGKTPLNGNPSTTAFTFADDDAASGGVVYTGCDVCEGDLVIRAPQGTSLTMLSPVRVGAATAAYDAERCAPPRFIVDGAKLNMILSSRHFNLGGGLTAANTFANEAALIVTNGAYLSLDTFKIANGSSRATLKNRVHVDASTLYVNYELYSALQYFGDDLVPEYLFTRGAVLRATVDVNRPVKFVFDASDFMGKATSGIAYETLKVGWNTTPNSYTYGDFHFVNGGRFYCADVATSALARRATRFHFDDGEWIPCASGNFSFAFTNVEICAEAGGFRLNPPLNATWSLPLVVTGAVGRVVKGGVGTLALTGADGAFAPGGMSAVEEGTLKLAAGAVAEGVRFAVAAEATLDLDGTVQTRLGVAGPGAVANGTLVSPILCATVSNDGATGTLPALGADVTVTGAATVDLGRTRETPVATFGPFAVATNAGAAPDVSGWKLRNSGVRNARGVFTAADGVVRVTVETTGMALIFR